MRLRWRASWSPAAGAARRGTSGGRTALRGAGMVGWLLGWVVDKLLKNG